MEPLPVPSLFERIMATLPGWMLLLGGVAMVAMITLVPPWLECRRLDWQAQVMALQSQQLTGQQVAYEQFLTALREDDPVVVERMAYYHLRLKPVGTSTLDELHQMQTTQAAAYNQFAGHPYAGHPELAVQPLNKVWSTLPTIEDLLAKPMYRPSQYCPAGVVPDTRMVRLVTGPARHLMLGFGVLCLFFGLLPASAGSIAMAKSMEDQYTDDYDDTDDGAVAVADETVEADELGHLFPDATSTAWAMAGTGAVSVSAAGPVDETDQDVLVAELDTQDETLVEALTDELEEADLVEAELVEAELDDAAPVVNDKEIQNDEDEADDDDDADDDAEEEEEVEEETEDADADDLEDEEEEFDDDEDEEEDDEGEFDEDDEDEEFEDDDEEDEDDEDEA